MGTMNEKGLVFFLVGIGEKEGQRILASIKEQIDKGDKHIFVFAPIGFELHILEVPTGRHVSLEHINPEALRAFFVE